MTDNKEIDYICNNIVIYDYVKITDGKVYR